MYRLLYTYLQPYFCIIQIKGILKNRTQIEEWIEDKAIRRRWQHQRHKERSDSEDSSDEEEGQETTKEKASSKKITGDLKPFVYPYDVGWKRNLAQVSVGAVVGTLCLLVRRLFDVNSVNIAGSGASTPETNSRQQPLSSVRVHCEAAWYSSYLEVSHSLHRLFCMVVVCS